MKRAVPGFIHLCLLESSQKQVREPRPQIGVASNEFPRLRPVCVSVMCRILVQIDLILPVGVHDEDVALAEELAALPRLYEQEGPQWQDTLIRDALFPWRIRSVYVGVFT